MTVEADVSEEDMTKMKAILTNDETIKHMSFEEQKSFLETRLSKTSTDGPSKSSS